MMRGRFEVDVSFRVISWNVNSVNVRLERLQRLLTRHAPDVVCLQELKCLEEKFPSEEIKTAGYHFAVFGQKTYNGVAILSRTPLENVQVGFSDGVDDAAARFIVAKTSGVHVASVYVPNGQSVGTEAFAYKLQWLQRLRQFLDNRFNSGDPVILGGDFNIAPEERDVHDPAAWEGQVLFSEPERNALSAVREFGLEDTFRLHHSEKGLYSWWDYRQLAFPFNKGLRIDFIFATPSLAKRCVSAEIDRDERKGEKPSDHAPVIAEFSA